MTYKYSRWDCVNRYHVHARWRYAVLTATSLPHGNVQTLTTSQAETDQPIKPKLCMFEGVLELSLQVWLESPAM
jgi:hypothetical protein